MFTRTRSMVAAALLAVVAAFAPAALRAADGGVLALGPHPNEHVTSPPATITVEITGRTSLDGSAIRFTVDGHDVSDQISTNGNVVHYHPLQQLTSGEHAVEVSVNDHAGGRLSYEYTFTVDGAATTAQSSSASASASSNADGSSSPSDGASATPAAAADDSMNATAADGATGSTVIEGQQNFYGGFAPIGGGPYYWGDNAEFEFTGIPGGYGFVTFAGIPGVFDLLPLGLNTYYANVPIPIGFIYGEPYVICHFFTPNGRPTVVKLPTFHVVRHRRVMTEPVANAPMARSGEPALRVEPASLRSHMPTFTPHPRALTGHVVAPSVRQHVVAPGVMRVAAPLHLSVSPVMHATFSAPVRVSAPSISHTR